MSKNKSLVFFFQGDILKKAFESFLVLLNISTYCSVVPYVVFHIYSKLWSISLITLLNIIYLLFRFGFKTVKIPSDKLFFLFVCINICNVLTTFLSDDWKLIVLVYSLLNISFYLLLYNLYLHYRETESVWGAMWLIVRGYVWLGVLGVISAVCLFVLIKFGFNPLNTPVVDNYYDLFWSNVNVLGHTYYFPYHISVLLVPQYLLLKLPFFTDYGVICGIFHEPHVITFVVFPVLFVLWAYTKSHLLKVFYFIVWMLILLLEFSTTNIIALGVSLLIYVSVEKNKRFWLLPIGLAALLLFLYIGIENTELFMVADKLEGDDTGSRDYTLGTIRFAFTPETLFGSNFMNNDYLISNSTVGKRDVGYVPFFLNILFLLLFVFRMIKTVFLSQKYRLIGIAVLYFFIHSMKTAMVTYTSPQLLLMMFLLYITTSLESSENEHAVSTI